MSHPVLNHIPPVIDVLNLLDGLAQTFTPIARLRGIIQVVAGPKDRLLVHTSLESVLPPFISVWLKLLYLLPPGSRFEVATRSVTTDQQEWLRLQITTMRLYLNPNLLLSENAKILRLSSDTADSSTVYVDLLLDEPSDLPKPPFPELARKLPALYESEKLATATRQRIELFMQDGLTRDRVAASTHTKDAHFLEKIRQLIDTNLHCPNFDSHHLERELGQSRTQLFRKLKKLTGHATASYIRHVRLCSARDLLETTMLPVGEVAGRVGFPELSYFSHCFVEAFGQTPSDCRKRAKMKQ